MSTSANPARLQKEDFYTGGCAAVAGGVTTVLDEPNNTPVIEPPSRAQDEARHDPGKSLVDYGVTVALNDHNLDAPPRVR